MRLSRLFRPASIAVVGASPTSPWNLQMLENVRRIGFRGPLCAVNPKYSEVAGEPCYPDLASVPDPPEAILLAVGRDRAPGIIEEAAAVGVRGAVVVAGGFAEAGPEGRALQERMRAAADDADLAVIGPNCQGLVNVAHPSALYLDRIPAPPPVGRVGLISQSGTVTTALLNNRRGVRFSFAASTGNEAVVEAAEVLEYLVADPDTGVVVAFLETIRSPERFLAACEASDKPVVVMKAGRSHAAREAVAAHTGALAAPYRRVAASLRRAGALLVGSLEELLEAAVALGAGCHRPGRRLAAITLSGGQAEVLLDEVEDLDLEFPALAPATRARISELGLRPSNPLDAWGSASFESDFVVCLEALRDDAGIDAVVALVEATAEHPTGEPEISEAVAGALERAQAGTTKQLALLTTMSGNVDVAIHDRIARAGIPLLSGLRQGLVALERAATRAERSAGPQRHARSGAALAGRAGPERPTPRGAAAGVAGPEQTASAGAAAPVSGERPYSGLPAVELLARAGLDVVETVAAPDADDAVRLAAQFGYPVVLKTGNALVLHKTELGAVAVGLASGDEVRRAAREISARVSGGLLVQRQAPAGGVELILGLQRDPELGTFVLLGSGGIWAEVLDDVTMRPVPLRDGDAAAMLGELRAGPLLDGARGRAPADRAAVVRAVERLAELGAALGDRLESVDVNPLLALPDRALALDAAIVPAIVERRH